MQTYKADREPLAQYVRQQVICDGTISRLDRRPSSRKTYVNVCIQDADIYSKGSVFITHCHHIWVNDADAWDERVDLDKFIFKRIRFRALAKAYTDSKYQLSYALEFPQPFMLVAKDADRIEPNNQAPALKIPDPVNTQEHIIKPNVPMKESLFHPPTQPMAHTDNKFTVNDLTTVKAFIKACGGHDKASEIVFAIPDMPVDKIVECLSFLSPP